METAVLKLKNTLVLLKEKGLILTWSNNEIVSWYSVEGRKLETKSKYKKTPLAIVYLLRRNDLKTITKTEQTIASIKEIENSRSDELKRLRAQVDSFTYEKQNWARQSETMAKKIDEFQKKLKNGNNYISALEDCCDHSGVPVAAIKQAAINEMLDAGTKSDSDEDDIAVLEAKTQRDARRRAPMQEPEVANQISPMKTRAKSNDVQQDSVKVAVLKTITNTDDEITTISRPLTCEECS